MKKINCLMVLVLSIFLIQILGASESEENARIGKAVRTLIEEKGSDNITLRELEELTSSLKISAQSKTPENIREEELISCALQNPVSEVEQIHLISSDFTGDFPACDARYVYKIDLSEIDPSQTDITPIVTYFTENNLCNLRELTLPKLEVTGFLARIFSNDEAQQKYYSLLRIYSNISGISENDLDIIYDHFSLYSHVVRDICQTSSRYGRIAAFLTVEWQTSYKNNWMALWFAGKMTSLKHIYYRSGEPEKVAPLIVSLRTFV